MPDSITHGYTNKALLACMYVCIRRRIVCFICCSRDVSGMQSPLGVQLLINDLDIATLMDPQDTFCTIILTIYIYIYKLIRHDTSIL